MNQAPKTSGLTAVGLLGCRVLQGPQVSRPTGDQDVEDRRRVDRRFDQPGVLGGDDRFGDGLARGLDLGLDLRRDRRQRRLGRLGGLFLGVIFLGRLGLGRVRLGGVGLGSSCGASALGGWASFLASPWANSGSTPVTPMARTRQNETASVTKRRTTLNSPFSVRQSRPTMPAARNSSDFFGIRTTRSQPPNHWKLVIFAEFTGRAGGMPGTLSTLEPIVRRRSRHPTRLGGPPNSRPLNRRHLLSYFPN